MKSKSIKKKIEKEFSEVQNLSKKYKTQISVENRFKQLKSSHFINSMFIKNPKRIEALAYLLQLLFYQLLNVPLEEKWLTPMTLY